MSEAYLAFDAQNGIEPSMGLGGYRYKEILSNRTDKTSVAFLLIHDQPHQIPHCAPIMNELSKLEPNIHIEAFVQSNDHADLLYGLLSPKALQQVSVTTVTPPLWARTLEAMIFGAAPLRRIGSSRSLVHSLAKFDLIVTPETTSLIYKDKLGESGPAMVYTQHGAGDRAVGFKPAIAKFDHVLVPGEKIKNRMLAEKIVEDGKFSVVGYPKFNAVKVTPIKKQRFFQNDLPTVVYNPHFDPHLSSWYKAGEAILDHFMERDDFNLIFAPHTMLWSRKLHITSDLNHIQWRKRIKSKYRKSSNIHIDTGSHSSINMTYVRAADIYLGDVSSQVYEFLEKPKPCVFLNCHEAQWQDDPNYSHWKLGEVVDSLSSLSNALDNISDIGLAYKRRQKDAFLATFGEDIHNSARRAAFALAGVLDQCYRNSVNS